MINAGIGVPHEYFNPVIMRGIAPRFGLATDLQGLKWRPRSLIDRLLFGNRDRAAEVQFLAKYVRELIPRRCQNSIFAAKIHFDQYVRVLDNRIGHRLFDGGTFIYLFREDLLGQAISRNLAYVTGQWGIDETVTTAPMPRPDLLGMSGIDREIETLADEDRGWRVFMAQHGISPISISYEQLCKDPTGLLNNISHNVGLSPQLLRHGYSEPKAAKDDQIDPSLPSKTEVLRRYLAAVHTNRGIGCPETIRPTQIPVPHEAAE